MGRRHRRAHVCRAGRRDGGAAWIDAAEISADDETVLAGWLADPDRPKVLHDAKGPMLALAARGWPLRGLAADTALSAYLVSSRPALLRPGRPHVALPAPRAEERGGVDRPADLRPRRRLRARAGVDAEGERRRRPRRGAWRPSSTTRGGSSLLADVELPLVDVLAKMEQVGIAMDIDHLTRSRRSSPPGSSRPPTTPTT